MMTATLLLLVAALFSSSAASGPSGSQAYGGYSQHQQLQQQYQPSGQQDRWSTLAQPSASATPESKPVPEEAEPAPLPEGWSEHFDPNSGQYYYYNANDGTTSWDRPTPPATEDQGANGGESKEDVSPPLEQNAESVVATGVAENSTPQQSVEPTNGMQLNQKEPAQENSWGSERQDEYQRANDWSSAQPVQQQPGGYKWGQSNSTDSSVVGGEPEVRKAEFESQPQQAQPSGWGLPQETKPSESSQKPVEPWGVAKSPEQQHQYRPDPQKQTPPPAQKDDPSSNGKWGMPKAPENSSPSDRPPQTTIPPPNQGQSERPPQTTIPPPNQGQSERPPQTTIPPPNQGQSERPPQTTIPPPNQGQSERPPQTTIPPPNQGQPWQGQGPTTGNQQRPPVQGGPPPANRFPPQQQPPGQPQYLQRQYPPSPYGSYNPNTPPGQGQYGQGQYGGQNTYGRGYPQQPNGSGQLVSQPEPGPSAVKEALSSAWTGLLGFGNRTREVVGTAKDQVVTGATAAGQTISARSSSIWESAKTTVGGVFENNDSGNQPPYSLSGHNPQTPPGSQPPPNFQGRPTGYNQGYPNAPGGPGGRGPPPRQFGGPQSQPGRYPPPMGQQPRYGAPPQSGSGQPPGRQQPPPNQQNQMKPPGYPNMQPRRDQPYPQTPKGQERGPMQSQYGNPQQPPQGAYPAQQRPPYPGPPGAQPNGGPGMTQPKPQQENPSDPWDHPALTGDY